MELLENLSDDQTALLGCFVVMVVSASIMFVSLPLKRALNGISEKKPAGSSSVRIPESLAGREEGGSGRKAA